MLTFVKHNIKQSNTLIFRGYNYNAPMAIILMMFKITMAWVSQFIQSVLVEKELLQAVAKIPVCLISVEASTGAFYWQHESEK